VTDSPEERNMSLNDDKTEAEAKFKGELEEVGTKFNSVRHFAVLQDVRTHVMHEIDEIFRKQREHFPKDITPVLEHRMKKIVDKVRSENGVDVGDGALAQQFNRVRKYAVQYYPKDMREIDELFMRHITYLPSNIQVQLKGLMSDIVHHVDEKMEQITEYVQTAFGSDSFDPSELPDDEDDE
jgi:Asp-tRNA(Asn)/Glu-tRNA(Gln) amidotransferase C subunit